MCEGRSAQSMILAFRSGLSQIAFTPSVSPNTGMRDPGHKSNTRKLVRACKTSSVWLEEMW
jgi:hypothetical protein